MVPLPLLPLLLLPLLQGPQLPFDLIRQDSSSKRKRAAAVHA
jgi:hypothetical protein